MTLIKMASSENNSNKNKNKNKVIVHDLLPHKVVYSDGTIDRPRNNPIVVPPQQEDPVTGVSSKDVVFIIDPDITARLFLPKLTQPIDQHNQKLSILVYFHGGAFCYESAFSLHHHVYCNILASQANIVIASIEHRKAPEHYLPAAYEDCWNALYWVASHATQNVKNSDPWITKYANFDRVFIGGDSSGANIAHNVTMRAGVEALPGGVKVFGTYLNHPCFWGATPIEKEPVIGFEEAIQSRIWTFSYPSAPGGLDCPMLNPLASGAPSLATLGCSRMLVTVAGKDNHLFRDRGERYYEAVKKSGWKGEIEFFEEKDEDHVYHMLDFETEQAKRLIKVVVDFLRH